MLTDWLTAPRANRQIGQLPDKRANLVTSLWSLFWEEDLGTLVSLPLFQKRRSSVSASTLVNFLTLNFLPPCFLFKFLCQLHANIFIAFYIFCALCEEHSYSLSFLRSGFPNVLINILTPTGHTHTQTAPLLLNVNDGQWTTFAVESWKKSYMLSLSQIYVTATATTTVPCSFIVCCFRECCPLSLSLSLCPKLCK